MCCRYKASTDRIGYTAMGSFLIRMEKQKLALEFRVLKSIHFLFKASRARRAGPINALNYLQVGKVFDFQVLQQ